VPKLRGVTIPRLWKRYNRLRRGSVVAEAEFVGEGYEEVGDPMETPSAAHKRRKLAAARKAAEAEKDAGSGPPFANQTLIDPIGRTFNWPFLCALVENVGARVPDITQRSLYESRQAAERSRTLEAARKAATQAAEAEALNGVGRHAEDEDEGGEDGGDDVVLYAGDEAGSVPTAGVGEDDEDGDGEDDDGAAADDEEADDFDEYDDEDTAHIETLIAISGSTGKYFDTVEWLRSLLFTLQMYIDGYCPDFNCVCKAPVRSPGKARLARRRT
jgi:hypothetical protein